MRPSALLTLSGAAVLAVCLGQARAGMVGGEVKWWRPEIDSKVKSTENWLEGTSISLEADLNLDPESDVYFFKIWLGGRDRITLSRFEIELSSKDFPDVNMNFGGETFSTAVELDTKLEATVYRVAWERDWGGGGGSRIASILGVQVFETSVSLENSLVGKEEEEFSEPVPIIGVAAEMSLAAGLGLYGEVAGLYIGYGDFEGGYVEWEAGVKLNLMQGRFFATAGYRELKIDVEEGDSEARLTFKGFIFGAGLSY